MLVVLPRNDPYRCPWVVGCDLIGFVSLARISPSRTSAEFLRDAYLKDKSKVGGTRP